MVKGKAKEDKEICEDISEFLFELLVYASDKDIKTFLFDCVGIKSTKEDILPLNNYKKILLNKIIEYFYYKEIAYRKRTCNDVRALYRHLYFMAKCYYSYTINFNKDKQLLNFVQSYIKNKKDINIHYNIITNRDKQKFLKILIESYAENKFYYYFYENKLVKVFLSSNKCTHTDYDECIYELKEIEGKTHIINATKGININLGKSIPKNSFIKQDISKTLDDKFLNYIIQSLYGMSFQEIKSFHNKIVAALTEKNREKCIYCNPDLNSLKINYICENCDNLLNKLEEQKKYIEEYEPNLFIRRIREQDFRSLILKIKYNEETGITGLRQERRNTLNKFVNKLEKELIKQTKQNKFKHTYTNYKKLYEFMKDIKLLIIKCFDD